jgi:hypothetical protein
MARYIVEAATRGTAWCEVEADSEDEALEAAGASEGWKQDDWDVCVEPYRGGFIVATKQSGD